MIDELCGCGFKDSCYVHCDHDLEACPGKPYKGSDLVSLDNQSQDEPVKSATPDIDTQIESLVEQMCMHSQKAPDGTVTVIYEGLSPKAAHKAIKTLLIQSKIDELEKMKTEWGYGEYPMDNPRYGMDWEDWIDYRTQTLKSTTKEK